MKLTNNEKKVLKLLLDDGRIADATMATSLKISTQAIGKIRKKLEENGVIEGYSCNVSFEKLGIRSFTLGFLDLNTQFWEERGQVKGRETIKNVPHTIFACIPPGSDTSALVLQAFRNGVERDRYLHLVETKYAHYGKYKKTYMFSSLNFLKNNPKDLIKLILDQKPIVPKL
jgi:DNA-binding Lrp family transcriptional regulator